MNIYKNNLCQSLDNTNSEENYNLTPILINLYIYFIYITIY